MHEAITSIEWEARPIVLKEDIDIFQFTPLPWAPEFNGVRIQARLTLRGVPGDFVYPVDVTGAFIVEHVLPDPERGFEHLVRIFDCQLTGDVDDALCESVQTGQSVGEIISSWGRPGA